MKKQDDIHPEDRRNLIIFAVAALVIWFSYDQFVLKPRMDKIREANRVAAAQAEANAASDPYLADTPAARDDVLERSPRITIENEAVRGSLALRGARIDDLALKRYYKTLEDKENVVLLSPAGSKNPKYVELGWVSAQRNVAVPGSDTLWRAAANGAALGAEKAPVVLTWDNGAGLRFENVMSIDDNYMIRVTQKVTNSGAAPVTLHPYALVSQQSLPADYEARGPVHQGPIAYVNGELTERPYRKMAKEQGTFTGTSGWIGISEKYWFTSIVPEQEDSKTFRFIYVPSADKREKYQTDVTGAARTVEPGQTVETTFNVFAGAKEVKLLEKYEESVGVRHFDLAVDFGLYYFMTKPFFYILDFFGRLTGNFGIAILCLTIMVRLLVFPLANTSYRSFAKMSKISPMMKELREKYGDDKTKLQGELVKLYEKEKVNPMAGCLPILIQIPIFFALYKTLNVTIEMRHAPFFGWIKDLSAQDPTSVFNLFGLIPWQPPAPLMIGAWSCMMLVAMLIQRRLSPPPQDPIQKGVADVMPFMMAYIMAKFAAGLVIYWTFSNFLSIIQQYVIMRSMGVEVHFFRRRKEDKEMDKLVKEGPVVHPEFEVAEDAIEDALRGNDADTPAETKTVSPPKPRKKKKR